MKNGVEVNQETFRRMFCMGFDEFHIMYNQLGFSDLGYQQEKFEAMTKSPARYLCDLDNENFKFVVNFINNKLPEVREELREKYKAQREGQQ